MHKLPIIPYNLRKRSTKQKPSKLKPMTTPTPSTSNLQDAIIPTTNSLPSPTSTSQNIQLSPPISTSPSVNPPNPPTTNFSLTHPEPTVALSSSPHSQVLFSFSSNLRNMPDFQPTLTLVPSHPMKSILVTSICFSSQNAKSPSAMSLALPLVGEKCPK